MIRVQEGELARYHFESFSGDGLIHGVFTRLGGFSLAPFEGLNLSHKLGDDPARVSANHQAIYRTLGIEAGDVVTARQVHGDRVAVVSAGDSGRIHDQTDALISNLPGLLLLMRFADCVPVLLYAPRQGAVGLAHAGWQGTAKGIVAKTARAMMRTYGCLAQDLLAGLGPGIGPCCFEVGADVVDAMRSAFGSSYGRISRLGPRGKIHIDLWRANALQLEEVGLARVEVAQICTCCRQDEFFSHRGENGRTGRFGAVIGLSAQASWP